MCFHLLPRHDIRDKIYDQTNLRDDFEIFYDQFFDLMSKTNASQMRKNLFYFKLIYIELNFKIFLENYRILFKKL